MNGITAAVRKGKGPRTRAGTGCRCEPVRRLRCSGAGSGASSGRGQQAKLGEFWSPNCNSFFLLSGPGPAGPAAPALPAFPPSRGVPALGSSLGPPLAPLPQLQLCPVLRAPELDAGLPRGSQQSGVEGQNPLPRPVPTLLGMQPGVQLAFLPKPACFGASQLKPSHKVPRPAVSGKVLVSKLRPSEHLRHKRQH